MNMTNPIIYDLMSARPEILVLCMAMVILLLVILVIYVTMVYGPIAAFLVESFPARVRYTSMSVPYHIGTGYFGGFLPLIAGYIVARTGDIYAGQWYGFVLLVVALVVGWWGLKDGPPRDFADDHA